MPRNIDLNNLPPLEEIKAGPIKDLLKPALLSIAGALEIEIPTKISVPEIEKQISEALNTPKFSSDTRTNKKLHDKDLKTDPPPQYKRLGGSSAGKDQVTALTDASSLSSSEEEGITGDKPPSQIRSPSPEEEVLAPNEDLSEANFGSRWPI
ncbi:hypothetical protein B0H14DRAFT_3540575 [Mycena olivaceomarginata]|nr:hypothetical protein B0H14DRAFT_3540575 [Mycena olivaceomarginata]